MPCWRACSSNCSSRKWPRSRPSAATTADKRVEPFAGFLGIGIVRAAASGPSGFGKLLTWLVSCLDRGVCDEDSGSTVPCRREVSHRRPAFQIVALDFVLCNSGPGRQADAAALDNPRMQATAADLEPATANSELRAPQRLFGRWWRRQSPTRQDRFATIGPLVSVLLFLAAIICGVLVPAQRGNRARAEAVQARHRDRAAADPPAPDREPGAARAHRRARS